MYARASRRIVVSPHYLSPLALLSLTHTLPSPLHTPFRAHTHPQLPESFATMSREPTTAFRPFSDEELTPVVGGKGAAQGGGASISKGRAIMYCLLNACLTGCLYGYSTGIIAGTGQSVVHDFFTSESSTDDRFTWLWSFVTADILFGGMFGSIVGPPIADKIGRKWALVVTGVLCAIFSIGLAVIAKVDGGMMFYLLSVLCRTFLGVSVGMSCTVGPTYTNEMAPEGMAGKLGTMFQLFLCGAITLAYAVNYVFNLTNDEFVSQTSWRIEFGIGALFGVALALCAAFILPETPQYLAMKAAASSGGNIGGGKDEERDVGFGDAAAEPERAEWLRFFAPKKIKDIKYLVLATMLAVSQQLTGINAVMFYAPVIFKAAGVQNTALITFLVAGLWNIASVFPATILSDKLGRRPLMVAALGAMAAALWIMGGGTKFFCDMEDIPGAVTHVLMNHTFVNVTAPAVSSLVCQPAGSGLLIAGVMIFLLAFECGPGPLFFVIASEMFEVPKLKSVGLAYCNVVAWILNIVITLSFPKLKIAIGPAYTYWILAVVATVSFVFLLVALPETGAVNKQVTPYSSEDNIDQVRSEMLNDDLKDGRAEAASDA